MFDFDALSHAIGLGCTRRLVALDGQGFLIARSVAVFCSDDAPKTPEGLKAFRSFAERQVGLWTTAPLPESDGEMPTVAIRVREPIRICDMPF